jgi:hypothetical protein
LLVHDENPQKSAIFYCPGTHRTQENLADFRVGKEKIAGFAVGARPPQASSPPAPRLPGSKRKKI